MKNVSDMTRAEVTAEIVELTGSLKTAFKEMGADYDASKITVFAGDAKAKGEQLRDGNARLGDLTERKRGFDAMEAAAADVDRTAEWLDMPKGGGFAPEGGNGERKTEYKSLGARFVESLAYKGNGGGEGWKQSIEPEVAWDAAEVKTDFQTSAGWAPPTVRTGVVTPFPTRPLAVVDLVPVLPTEQSAYTYMRETTFTNNAAEAAEEAQFAEAALALTEVSETIRKIAVFLPVSDEQMSDIREAQAYVDARLPFMLRQRLDSQLVAGDGNAPNIKGYLHASNLQTQALGADPVFDAIFKAATLIQTVGFADAEAIVMHPTDWQNVRLLRTAQGIYIMGNPADNAPKALFGLPVTTTTAITSGTALVGAFSAYSGLATRSGIDLKVSDSHSDFFIKGKQAIRATMRCALVVFRGQAFCQVTGL